MNQWLRGLTRSHQETDPTRADIRIYIGHGCWQPASAILDTGTKDEWVSDRILSYCSAIEDDKPLEEPKIYTAFNGQEFRATRRVVFSWQSEKNRITRKSTFRVMENAPFDVIIGSNFLFRESVLTLNEAALLLLHGPVKQGKCIEIHLSNLERF